MSFWIQYPDLIFEEESHRYFWDGVQVQGVTRIFDRIGIRKNDIVCAMNSIVRTFGVDEVIKKVEGI